LPKINQLVPELLICLEKATTYKQREKCT